jgi:predicted phosphodiesterase
VARKKRAKKPRICPVCKKNKLVSTTAKRCVRCYWDRKGISSKKRTYHCSVCGKEVSYKKNRCRECYLSRGPDKPRHLCRECGLEPVSSLGAMRCERCRLQPGWHKDEPLTFAQLSDTFQRHLRKTSASIEELGAIAHVDEKIVRDTIEQMRAHGRNLFEFGGRWSLEKVSPTGAEPVLPYVSRPDGTYLIGIISDTHFGSKYERLDACHALYNWFQDEGVDRVFHSGNWIDGEARFNKYDIHTHGMDAQIQYHIDNYPRIDAKTYAVAGDDHEGWYGQREGIDIGRHCQRMMHDAGRDDWVHVGYMEAFIPLQHYQSEATVQYHLIHPGGGSSYAISYTVQKIVESYDGGEKPAVLQAGHYHKAEFINIRNVWVVQAGSCQDQTPFMRKKKLRSEVAGAIMKLTQHEGTGAIERCSVEFMHFFNRGFHVNNRWSHAGDVKHVPRL